MSGSTSRSRESLIHDQFSASLAAISDAFQPVANLLTSGKSIHQSFPGSRARLLAALLCGGLLLPLAGRAAEDSAPVQDAPVQATWKTQEIRYSYTGFTTAYDCNAAEDRLKAILRALGAHEQTRVAARGCEFNRPSRNFFITITAATPVPLADAPKETTNSSREALLKRLGVPSQKLDETFPAQWTTVDLSRDRKLNLQPGDCELMKGLRDHVLPKLSVKIEADRVDCIPRQVSIRTPELKVSALVPLASPDASSTDAPAGKPNS